MKTAVVYHSSHHGNTKKLLDAMAQEGEVTLLAAASNLDVDLAGYELIGFASGTYASRLHEDVLRCAERNLPSGKPVFVVYTYGAWRPKLSNLERIVRSKGGMLLGVYGCPGFCTFGPLKLIGGIAKGRPNAQDTAAAAAFFKEVRSRVEGKQPRG